MSLDVIFSNVENYLISPTNLTFEKNSGLRLKKHAFSTFENVTSRDIEASNIQSSITFGTYGDVFEKIFKFSHF